MKKTILLIIIFATLVTLTSAQAEVEIKIEDKGIGAGEKSIEWQEENGDTVEVIEGALNKQITPEQTYDLKKQIETPKGNYEVEIREFSINEGIQGNLRPESQLIDYNYRQDDLFFNQESFLYAFNSENFEMKEAELTIPSNNQPDVINHCINFNYEQTTCNTWDTIKLEENEGGELEAPQSETIKDVNYDNQELQFTTNGFSAFGSAENAPQPVIQEIEIYDVTELEGEDREDNTDEENLEDSITVDNTTVQNLELDQADPDREYRYDFIIENEGEEDWNIQDKDELSHEGLDNNWNIDLTDGEEELWYTIEDGSKQRGGTFTEGRIEWDTSNQGTLQHEDGESDSDQMTASYIIETDQDQTETYNQDFRVEVDLEDQENTGSADEHQMEITKYGELKIDLIHPPDQTIVQKEDDRTFLMEAEISCEDGECGEVTSEPRYNEISKPDTIIPEFDSHTEEPFRLDEEEEAENQCGEELNSTEICNVAWDVLPEGDLETTHLLDVESDSNLEEVDTENSENHEVTIDRVIFMELEFTDVTFGTLDPGESDEAEGNTRQEERDGYQINITENSLSVDELWISGTPLENEEEPDEYQIGPGSDGNLTMNTENERNEDETFISETFQRFETDINPGTIIDTFFWIDVPLGVLKGDYTGEITFKANSTQE